jgi:hypothetical protein
LGSVSVRVNGRIVIDGVVEGTLSKYVETYSDSNATISVENSETHSVLAQTKAPLLTGKQYTLQLTGTNAQPKLDVFDDNDGYLRIVNLSGQAVTVSLYQPLDSKTPFAMNGIEDNQNLSNQIPSSGSPYRLTVATVTPPLLSGSVTLKGDPTVVVTIVFGELRIGVYTPTDGGVNLLE